MKIVGIIGGLGNQMFQYALLAGLRETFKEDIYADVSGFEDYHLHNGLELERVFPIKLKTTDKEIRHFKRLTLSRYANKYLPILCSNCQYEYPDFRYVETVYIKDRKDCYYLGYWHHHSYVDKFRDQLLHEFRFLKPLNEKNSQIVTDMQREESVGIHIRRGDYLKEKQYQGICEKEYYAEAIGMMRNRFKTPRFYVFSNDVVWCQENLTQLFGDAPIVFVDWNTGEKSYCDMQLMTYCKGLIIANSSFSWWGAFLNQQENVYVIAPKRWKNAKYDLKIQMPEWTLI